MARTTKATKFERKTLRTPRSMGARLSSRRQQLGLSLEDAERQTKIQESYLRALEEDRHEELPPVYLRGLLRNYATYLGLSPDDFSAHFSKEHTVRENVKRATRVKTVPQASVPRVLVTPRRLVLVALVVGVLAVFSYIWIQASALTAPPKLTITRPAAQQVVDGDSLTLVGSTDIESTVYVDDTEVPVDDNGNFREVIALQNGINQIRITATDKLGKQTTIYRDVLAQIVAAATPPPQQPSGVVLMVKVGPHSAHLTVSEDGKTAFDGVVLAGSTETYRANSTIELSTDNAGSTSLTLTDQKVTNKFIGVLGGEGQAKDDLIFTSDTMVQ